MQQATNLQIMEEFVIKEHFVLEIEKNYKVSIQHVESCDQVFVQIFEDANSIKQMQTLIKSLHPSLKTCQSSLKPGSYVTTDCFLRAKAIQVTGDEVEIYNIDVGTTYFVSLGSLSRLNKGGSWSEDATKFCLKLISVGMSMIMKVVQIPTTIL
uniref:Tudor domain-containing protein n=1 Tax=Ciona intestinalis TaxID=7719 RepID=H2XW13_CIOIN